MLAAAITRESPDLVLLGQQAGDSDGAVLWAALADRLQLPLVSQAASLELGAGTVKSKRQTEYGYDVLEAPLPALVAVSDAINQPRYPSLKGIMGAKKKPTDTVTLADLGIAADDAGAGGLAHRGLLRFAAALARRHSADRGRRRLLGRADPRVPRGAEARMSVLVFVEHHEGEAAKSSLGVLANAGGLGDVAAVLLGDGVRGLAEGLGAYGASKVYVADDPALADPLPQPRVDVLADLVRSSGATTVLFAATVLAADVASGLAARLGAGLNWDLVALENRDGKLVGTRPALGDSVLAEVGWTTEPRIALIRSGTYEPTETGGGAPEIVDAPVSVQDWSKATKMLERAHEEASGPSIEDADVIVAGGRGLGEPDKFALLEELAKELGGAVAATRAVVDAGWYPYATQVGQTGKTVSPKLYIAAGISGAIQHKVGMQSSGTIVAINKDPNAPIFEYADLSVVGDLHAIVPKLTELVRARRG